MPPYVEPDSFADLLTHMPRLFGVAYTGNPELTLDLDRRCCGRRTSWARKTWRALSALEAYVQARARGEINTGFWHYCRSGAAPISHHQVGQHESTSSMQRWPQERFFPVPTGVDPRGRAQMVAHIRIDSRPPAPRVYYLDRTGHGEGVLVGYIGAHLTTDRT